MFQLPVNNLSRIRKARKKVKKTLEDIGLEFCKEAAEEFKDFCPDEETVSNALSLDIFSWDASNSKIQKYRSKTFCCTECSFSSKYYSGYKNHFRNVHRKLRDNRILLNCPYCAFIANRGTMETHVKIFHLPVASSLSYGNPQQTLPERNANLERNTVGHGLKTIIFFCKKCSLRDPLYDVVRKHIYREHFQHIVSPYLSMTPKSKVKNGASSANNILFCKQCQFCSRSYEALVQHVLDYHERIGSQVSTMIGHASVVAPVLYPASVGHKPSLVDNTQTFRSQLTVQPAVGQLQPAPSIVKNKSVLPVIEMRAPATGHRTTTESNGTGVNTAQTQKWKICTVCNELFPENLYSAHFESAHKAKKVWALAKYIMKIHNFTSKCLLCNRYLPSDTLLNHMLVHGLTCPQCHTAFNSVEKIIEHTALAHPDEYVGPPGASPLTFDLTFKQGKSGNIQLAVLTFNMKESVNGQNQAAPIRKNLSVPVKPPSANMIDKAKTYATLIHNSEVGKTVCPLCFTILKGPISDSLAIHLRERHQVIQTLHPVEQKMTYKCIHCLGVYTSNMVASTITLHLVQCRAVGRNQANQGIKPGLTVNSLGASTLKRQQPTQASTNFKRMKVSNARDMSDKATSDGLALDPTGYRHKTSKVRREFLTSYFNQQPYPTSQEIEKLSKSLWVWKTDIANHFATMQKLCVRKCRTKKVHVKLGFEMNLVKRYKHNLIFDKGKLVGISTRTPGSRINVPNNQKYRRSLKPAPALKPSTCTETISIDSDTDTDPESEDVVLVDEVNMKEAFLEFSIPPGDMESSLQDENENESSLPIVIEIPSPRRDEKESQSSQQDDKESQSPQQDDKESQSPQQDDKESQSPQQDETEVQSPQQDEKESQSPQQDEKEVQSLQQDEKEMQSFLQDETENGSSQPNEKEIESSPQVVAEIIGENESSLQEEKVNWSSMPGKTKNESSLQNDKENESSLHDNKENTGNNDISL